MSESNLEQCVHGAISDEIAAAEALDTGTVFHLPSQYYDLKIWLGSTESPTLAPPKRGGRKAGSKNKKPSSSQKPHTFNQHFPTLSDDEEKRLDQYMKAIREVRINADGRGTLTDFVRLAYQMKIDWNYRYHNFGQWWWSQRSIAIPQGGD